MAAGIETVIQNLLLRTQKEQGPLFGIQRCWPLLVGEGLAAHSKPVRLAKGKLWIDVDHPGDGFELSYRRPTLLKRVREQTGGQVEEIVIRSARTRVSANAKKPHGVSD